MKSWNMGALQGQCGCSGSRSFSCLASSSVALWLLAGALCPTASAETNTFLPRGATVVLLIGLPGDVESETAYGAQLQGWLDWLAAQETAPRQLFVFWDNPESLHAPAPLAAKFSAARREAFLALGTQLAGQTNPLVVIVWGHGGTQGQTPVFHVRGPRLTPDDVQGFAAQIPDAESRWILYFRGSGRFARELTASHRQVISSEHDLAFASDPIGLPLLLKFLRASSSNSWDSVTGQLGKAVSDWYEERSLARTEAPTLWLPGQEPRELVPADRPAALTSSKQATDSTAESPEEKPASSEEPPAGLPAAWKEIARVEPRKFQEADALVLRRRVRFTLGSTPAISSEQEEYVQILTEDGKHHGDFNLEYSPPQEELNVLDCEVLGPDGKVVRLDPEAVRESAEAGLGDYRAARRKFFSLPGVAPGAVLRVHYRTEWKTYPLPHVSLALPLAEAMPILDSQIQVTVPKDSAFHFAFDESAASEPAIQQTELGSTYCWHFTNLPAWRAEALAPPHFQPALLISTWADWAAFAEWYGRLTKRTDELTPELKEKAQALTARARDEREKVLVLYNYVTGLRYVAVPLGVNSFRPHAAAQVLKNQFGDCKDKANLFNTLLHALGLEAQLVLVPRFSQAHDAMPGFSFNHAISRVAVGRETLWLDTTDDVCRFGLLPPGDSGRKVLVIDGQSAALTPLPLPQPKDHQLELRAQIQCAVGSDPSPVSWRVTATGFPDYELRSTAREMKAHHPNLPLLAARYRLSTGTFSLARQSFSPVVKLDENFVWQAEGQCLGLVASAGGQSILRAPFWLPQEWEMALHQRTLPLFLNQGYPLTLDEEIEFTLPAGGKPLALPDAKENSHEPLRWKIEWTQGGDRTWRVRLRVALARGEFSTSEVPPLQNSLREFLTALANRGSLPVEH